MTEAEGLPIAWIIEQTDPHEDKIFEGSRKLVWHPYAAWYDTETWGDGRAMWVRTPLGPANALQQAISERGVRDREIMALRNAAVNLLDRAESAEAQVQRLTASLEDEREACANVLDAMREDAHRAANMFGAADPNRTIHNARAAAFVEGASAIRARKEKA